MGERVNPHTIRCVPFSGMQMSEWCEESAVDKQVVNILNCKLLDFLSNIDFCTLVKSDYESFDCFFNVSELFNDGEYIHTCANEVPCKDGGWKYNDGFVFDFYYVLLGDDLLVVEQKTSIDFFPGDSVSVRFLFYPNTSNFFIKVTDGHRKDKPYINIVDSASKLISQFYFEVTSDKSLIVNGALLHDVIVPLTFDELKNRCAKKCQSDSLKLCMMNGKKDIK